MAPLQQSTLFLRCLKVEITINIQLVCLCRTYGFILTIQDLSPNIGVFWYFFAEVFDFFRSFFLIVFHGNILLMIVPLALRLNHRPCFLAFVYIVLSSMLKSYPS
ncbi:phosphatidylinositol glycan anchor biosynthesis class U, partial [Trifolium pratense]